MASWVVVSSGADRPVRLVWPPRFGSAGQSTRGWLRSVEVRHGRQRGLRHCTAMHVKAGQAGLGTLCRGQASSGGFRLGRQGEPRWARHGMAAKARPVR